MRAINEKKLLPHAWQFFRAGGFDQVHLETVADLFALESLDQKLWVALSFPVDWVEFDRRTLELIDTDHDGHIRVPEILAAVEFVRLRLRDPDILLAKEECVPLSAISSETPEGACLLDSARAVLESLGKGDASSISIADAGDSEKIFSQTRFNGDGVVTVTATDDECLKAWITRLLELAGGELDRSGEQGVNALSVERFGRDATAWLEWQEDEVVAASTFLPVEGLESAVDLFCGIKTKIDDYFTRCRLAEYDSRAASVMNVSEEILQQLAPKYLSDTMSEIADLPLSSVSSAMVLDLEQGVNPAWAEQLARFQQELLRPLYGDVFKLGIADWENIKSQMSLYEEWWGGRVEGQVPALGRELLGEWRDKNIAEKITLLIEQDLAVKEQFEAIVELERLARYCRDIYSLANNFVSFRDFYTGAAKAIFQAGTLYLDGRSCELCVRVSDINRHALLANLSRVFLVYCECVRAGGGEKITIAAAFTNGDSDQLMVGRNGIFYDRKGRDWDAAVVRIIDHPISIRQAFWAPYKRIGKMVGEQIQKLAAARSKAAEDRAALQIVSSAVSGKEAPKQAQQQAFDVGKFAGIFAAVGLAIGAIGTAVAATLTGFLKLAWWQMPLVIMGIILLISGPAVIIAWLKLHQRNLGPILDANGWAVNARARLNIPFGASLTAISRLPEGSRQSLTDPFAEKRAPWKRYLLLIFLLLLLILFWRAKLSGFSAN